MVDRETARQLTAIGRALERIEANQRRLMSEEDVILKEEEVIEKETNNILAHEQELKKKLTRMRFSDMSKWRAAVWEFCEHKASNEEAKEINYFCKKLGKSCRFEDCPLNRLE